MYINLYIYRKAMKRSGAHRLGTARRTGRQWENLPGMEFSATEVILGDGRESGRLGSRKEIE